MKILAKQLLHLPVETQSGMRLGEIDDMEMDIDQHNVLRYVVRPAFVPRPFAKELIITPTEVVSITAVKMIVKDGVVPVGDTVPSAAA